MYIPFVILVTVFMWMGFICSISFMEAWLKFRAPGVTPSIGLGIGKLVFRALNKVECFFAIIILIFFLSATRFTARLSVTWYVVTLLILVLQTVWLLPALETRANAKIKGESPGNSSVHWYFVIAEVVKLIALFFLGKSFFDLFINYQS